MSQMTKIILSIAAFALIIAGAAYTYDTLSEQVKPNLGLAGQPGRIITPPIASQEEVSSQGNSTSSKPEKMKALDFTVFGADGSSVNLSSLEGKPIVLNFWASWCPPCKAEMPEFDKLYTEFGNAVHFMMVDMTDGQRETKEKGAKYVADQGFSFPVYYDTLQEASYTYGVRSIPSTIFIDKDGYIVTGAKGQLDEETLRYGISLIQGR